MNLLIVISTASVTLILCLVYIKFFQKNDVSKVGLDELKKDKDHEIELLKSENEKELSVLREQLNSLETEKENLKETLNKERETTAKQLETLGKVDAFKTSVTTNMGEYSQMIEKQQKFIDKLTGNAKYQGDFGERFLEQSLNFHGFKLGIDYTKQKKEEVYNLEEDKSETTKPDIVLNLADTHIICDSKVSLDNWKKFVNAENDEVKNEQFKKHYQAVKKHIDELSKKDYMKNLKKEVFQKVIMYMAHEAAYLSALEYDPTLYDYAYKKNILLVGPKNLLAIISIVQTIRDKEKQINSVAEITNTASNLMEKYSLLKTHLIKTMTSFNSHGENLKKVINGAYLGRNSLEQRIEKLKDLGINSSTPIQKTNPLQDKLMDFEEVKDKNEEEKKEPLN
jgi:DNA recombination protein RmuC